MDERHLRRMGGTQRPGEGCMPLEKAQREEEALRKGLGVSEGVAEEPDGI